MKAATPQLRGTWAKKLARLVKAEKRASEDVLVAIYEATEAGLTQADVAYMIGDASSSGVRPKAVKGAKIVQERTRTT
jgi:hypothetical protein